MKTFTSAQHDKVTNSSYVSFTPPANFKTAWFLHNLPDAIEGSLDSFNDTMQDAAVFSFAGRMMFKNMMGKIGFARIKDESGTMQIMVKKQDVPDEMFALWKSLDVGDIVFTEGKLMRTQAGEPTLRISNIRLLTKCIEGLPDKWNGISDIEIKRRKRYLDMITDADAVDLIRKRSSIVSQMRDYMQQNNFIEVETPMLHAIPGGATAKPFSTHHNALDNDMFLRIAPELFLKRLVVGGMSQIFEIGRCFRNEGIDSTHNPEFTTMECYWAYADWRMMMQLIEKMLMQLSKGIDVHIDDVRIDMQQPFQHGRMDVLIATALNADVANVYNIDWMREQINNDTATLGECWSAVFDNQVQPTLMQPTFVTHHLKELSPLARTCDSESLLTERFELFIAGKELANGFNELSNPFEQHERFAEQVKSHASGNDEAMLYDDDFIDALSYGLPPTAGAGIGVDRLAMLLLNKSSIRDVIAFPTLRKII